MQFRSLFRTVLPLILVAGFALQASARDLYWRSLDVQARLDPDGALHVLERHEMVFTGAWNGGERRFRLEPGQNLSVAGMARIVDGRSVVMEPGSLDAVDDWNMVDEQTLRWRSRLPSDPLFEKDALTYEIAYVLTGVVEKSATGYRLNHDFAFPDRDGVIEEFRVRLAIDEPWESPRGRLITDGSTGLLPGESFVVRVPLEYSGEGSPSAVVPVAGMLLRLGGIGLLAGAILLTFYNWIRRESNAGRLAPLPQMDSATVARELEYWRPELLGAAWDESVGAPEVAAVLARLAGEGKIETQVDQQSGEMNMWLKVPRDEFSERDRPLIDAMFVAGDHTSTAEIRRHYKSSGFNPSALISAPLMQELSQIRGWSRDERRRPWTLSIAALFASFIFWAASLATAAAAPEGPLVASALGGAATLTLGSIIAWFTSRRPHLTPGVLIGWNIVPLLYALVIAVALLVAGRITGTLIIAMVLGGWSAYRFVATVAHTTMTPPRLSLRRRLYALREWFRKQLTIENPELRDEWTPWLLALGLGHDLDRWFGSFGAATAAGAATRSSLSSSGASGSQSGGPGGSWTGGGTSFGGAGATATWVSAATGIASGVSSPSSSSGGGGGGSSSGGGGGGGW